MPAGSLHTSFLTPEFWESVVWNSMLWSMLFGMLYWIYSRVRPKAGPLLLAIAALFCVVYFDVLFSMVKHDQQGNASFTYGWMWERWWRTASYYSHGVAIIPIVCYLIWRKRELLRKIPVEPEPLGLWAVGIGLAMRVVASFPQVWFLSAFSIPLVLWGLILYFWGRRAGRELLFPIVFLVAMIPLPLITIDKVAVLMRNLGTVHTAKILNSLGITALQDATYIHLWRSGGVETVQVGDVCSGLRSLIALLAFGAIFAYLVPRTRVGKAIIFFASVPVAYVANLARIVVLTLLAQAFGSAAISPADMPKGVEGVGGFFSWLSRDSGAAMSWAWHNTVHYGTGLVIFMSAFFALLGVNWLVGVIERRYALSPKLAPEPPGAGQPPPLAAKRYATLVAALAVTAILTIYLTVGKPVIPDLRVAESIAMDLGPWKGESIPVDNLTKKILETDNIIIRNYTRPGEPAPVTLAIIYSENDRKVAHPPPICYAGAGWTVEKQDTAPLHLDGDDPADRQNIARCTVEKSGFRILALYWYMTGDVYTGNYLEAQLRLLINKLLRKRTSIALIRLSTTIIDNDIDAAEERIRAFINALEPELRKRLIGDHTTQQQPAASVEP